jgi:hypothetical protein
VREVPFEILDVATHLLKEQAGPELPVLKPDRFGLTCQRFEQAAVRLFSVGQAGLQLFGCPVDGSGGRELQAEFAVIHAEDFTQELSIEFIGPRVAVLPSRHPGLQGFPTRQDNVPPLGCEFELCDQTRL